MIYKATRQLAKQLSPGQTSPRLPLGFLTPSPTQPSRARCKALPGQDTTPGGSSRGDEVPACSQNPLLAAREPAGLRHSFALPSSGVAASPAASPPPSLLMIVYSRASEIPSIVSNLPAALVLSHPLHPEKGAGGVAGTGTDPATPALRPLSGSPALGKRCPSRQP